MTPEEYRQAIEEFKIIYREVCGIELSDGEAAIQAQGLLQLFDCLTFGMDRELK